jgi:murein L,D-transpeptidase YafK
LTTRLSTTPSTSLIVAMFGLSFTLLANAAEPPSSQRSRTVAARVKPVLESRLAERGLRFGSPIFIRIFKESKELEVWMKRGGRFSLFQTYAIHHFSGTLGPKQREGDRQAPEGFYHVPPSQMNPRSRFHLAFNLGYPNRYDRAHNRTGSALMIHGSTVSIGCFAMTDRRIEEIYTLADAALRSGQKFFRVHIFPFRMTEANLRHHADSEWLGFWRNLKTGHDYFERRVSPPDVTVSNHKYTFVKAKD